MKQFYGDLSKEVTKQEKAHMLLAGELAAECIVLLENDGALPFSATGNIALYGNGARRTVRGGTGSGDVHARVNVTIEEGLERAGYIVTTKPWLDRYDQECLNAEAEHRELVREKAKEMGVPEVMLSYSFPVRKVPAVQMTEEDVSASDTDTAVYVISRNSGEGADRSNAEGDYLPFPEELDILKKLAVQYDKVVLVLNIGGVMDLSQIKDIPGINAIVLMTQLGNTGGDALASVLSGKVSPSGKTTDTWARRYADYPSSESFSHNNGDLHDEYYTEGIYVGYRYFDTFAVEPLYCFGYGRSYTDFNIRTDEVKLEDDSVKLSVSVTNIGQKYAGKEVVQVYYTAPRGELSKPLQELASFAKTKLLAPGETQQLRISFKLADMASYSPEDTAWVLEPGKYTVKVGNSSRSARAEAAILVGQNIKTLQLKNLFPLDKPLNELVPSLKDCEDAPELPTLHAPQDAIRMEAPSYQDKRKPYRTEKAQKLTLDDVRAGRCTVEELTAQLTVEEMAVLCVGTERGSMVEIVGAAGSRVPGSAGETSAHLEDERGIEGIIMADGPAGLRLQPHFKVTRQGELLPGGKIIGNTYIPFADDIDEANVTDHYQYCTAIPIGWALAQSWDTALMERAGDLVGEEMEKFHVDIWLAPALNIHRNPLCGRNFEYFSEDPVVSGLAAAAITRGVQKHTGKGVTIKHFAANNAEDNRYFSNSHVSERALREIYLKGFEIAVKLSQPLSVMTSYNLINGIHTANSYDLLQAVLRDEWGFSGFVMTDWYTTQELPELAERVKAIYPSSSSAGAVFAGNDLQMPGCMKNITDIIEAVTDGKELDGYNITLADLQQAAANIIRAVLRCTQR